MTGKVENKIKEFVEKSLEPWKTGEFNNFSRNSLSFSYKDGEAYTVILTIEKLIKDN